MILPVNFCTSFEHLGSSIANRAFTLSGLASILFEVTRHPKIFSFVTANTHFSGFKLRFAARRSFLATLFTTMSFDVG